MQDIISLDIYPSQVGFSILPKIRLPFLPVNFEKFTGKNGKIGKKTVNFVFRFFKVTLYF